MQPDIGERLRVVQGALDKLTPAAVAALPAETLTDFQEGKISFVAMLGVTPEELRAMYESAEAFASAARYQEAEMLFESLVDLVPQSAVFRASLATMQTASDKLEEAAANFDEAVRREPDNSFPYYARAQFRLTSGNGPAALADFEKALEIELAAREKNPMRSPAAVAELQGRVDELRARLTVAASAKKAAADAEAKKKGTKVVPAKPQR